MSRFIPLGLLFGFLLELGVMIAVGQHIGVFGTLLLVIASGMLGGAVVRAAGLGLMETMRQPPRDMKFASRDAAARFLLLLAGLLLILPGFVSDIAAIVLLPAPIRNWLAGRLMANAGIRGTGWQQQPQSRSGAVVIEGEAIEIAGEIEDPSRPMRGQ